LLDKAKLQNFPDFSHSQVQTMIGAIGIAKGYCVWIPSQDRTGLDWNLSKSFDCRQELPDAFESIRGILQRIIGNQIKAIS